MTRDQSLAWIEALDEYLKAKRNRGAAADMGYDPRLVAETERVCREALVESMVPIVTGAPR